jgi:RsiW-degrading membrane proteinase PrsW (M82 family)
VLFEPTAEPPPPAPTPAPSAAPSGEIHIGPLGLIFGVLVALIGGLFGIVGAVVQEVRNPGLLLLPILGAPIIEEALKPVGVYILQVRWPHLIIGRLHAAILAAIGGLTFGVIEALVYVFVYTSDPPDWFVTYRFTLPLVLHTTCSFLVGLGITRQLISWAQQGGSVPRDSRNFYLTAVAIHAAYNTIGIILSLAGVFGDVE